jgi:hypothetical protein
MGFTLYPAAAFLGVTVFKQVRQVIMVFIVYCQAVGLPYLRIGFNPPAFCILTRLFR